MSPETGEQRFVDGRVFAVHRIGAVGVGLVLAVFGLLGAVDGVSFLGLPPVPDERESICTRPRHRLIRHRGDSSTER